MNPEEPARKSTGHPDERGLREHLDRVLAGGEFRQSPRMQSFLRFVVEEALNGRGDQLKAYTIGLSVYQKGPDFDPTTDPIVRVDAGRLRRKLQAHYADEGADEQFRIDMPKGKYAPRFRCIKPRTEVGADTTIGGQVPLILVLPFNNLSSDPEQAFFCDGLTDEIIIELSRFPDVRVMGRQTSFGVAAEHLDGVDAASRIGARFVLEGAVRRGNDRMRVTVHLIDAADRTQIWAENFTSDLTAQDVIDVQDEITQSVAAAVAEPYGAIPRVLTEGAHQRTSESLNAYEWVLRFYRYWAEPLPERYELLRDNLPHAIGLDPANASLQAAYSLLCADAVRFFADATKESNEWLELAMKAARRAVELDASSPFAHQASATAQFHTADLTGFRNAADTALRLSPNHANLLADLAVLYMCLGDSTVAVPMAEKAISLNPHHPAWYHIVPSLGAMQEKNHDEAVRRARLQVTPGLTLTTLNAAVVLRSAGLQDEADETLAAAVAQHPDLAQAIGAITRLWNMNPWLAGLYEEEAARSRT